MKSSKTRLTAIIATVSLALTSHAQLFDLSATNDMSLSHSTAAAALSPPQAGNQNVGTGIFDWPLLASDGSGNTAVFASGLFTSTDWGGRGTFTSNNIDVSSVNTVTISGQYDGFFNFGTTEFSNFFYQLDAGPVQTFGLGTEDITETDVAVGVPNLDVSGANVLVVGFEYSHNGGSDFFNVDSLIVSEVPEPSTYAALSGICALAFAMLRRRRVR